jgi:hypothetical protein
MPNTDHTVLTNVPKIVFMFTVGNCEAPELFLKINLYLCLVNIQEFRAKPKFYREFRNIHEGDERSVVSSRRAPKKKSKAVYRCASLPCSLQSPQEYQHKFHKAPIKKITQVKQQFALDRI